MTDEKPRDLPTKENIVSRRCEMSLLPFDFIQLDAMRTLVYDAQPHDSLVFFCTRLDLDSPTCIDIFHIDSLFSLRLRSPGQGLDWI